MVGLKGVSKSQGPQCMGPKQYGSDYQDTRKQDSQFMVTATCVPQFQKRSAKAAEEVPLMMDILHELVYVYMYYTTRLPMLLVYEVFKRSCRISIINRSIHLELRALGSCRLKAATFCLQAFLEGQGT